MPIARENLTGDPPPPIAISGIQSQHVHTIKSLCIVHQMRESGFESLALRERVVGRFAPACKLQAILHGRPICESVIPVGIEIRTKDKPEVWGIYRFDANRLLICLVDHEDGSRPDGFSARNGSKRMLLTLKVIGVPCSIEFVPATGRMARRQSPDRRACCVPCRTTKSRNRSPSVWFRWCHSLSI